MPRADVGLENQGGARAHLGHRLRRTLDDVHHLIPLPFDQREHRIRLIGQARFAHDAHRLSDGIGHLSILVGYRGGNRKSNNHEPKHSVQADTKLGSMSDIASIEIPHEYVVCLDHVGIAVPDFDAAVEFYRSAFGWVNHHEEVNEEQGVREAMIGPKDMTERDGMIQLLAPLNEESTIAKFIEKKGPGLQQMCLRTNNMDALSEHLRSNGVRLLYPEPKIGTGGARINFVHPKDAGGVLLEITEPK